MSHFIKFGEIKHMILVKNVSGVKTLLYLSLHLITSASSHSLEEMGADFVEVFNRFRGNGASIGDDLGCQDV